MYDGRVKSRGGQFGFITCDAVALQYGGRDVFFSLRLVGDAIYAMMDVGSLVRFNCIEDKGQPQATNVQILESPGQQGFHATPPVPAPGGMGMQQQMGGQMHGNGAMGQAGGMQPGPQEIDAYLPAGCTAVSLHGRWGYFLPMEALQELLPRLQAGGPMIGQKRAHSATMFPPEPMNKMPRMEGVHPQVSPDNPGLLPDAPIYEGIIKRPPVERTGYGFVECAEVRTMHGRDVFLHVRQCPWVPGMNIQPNDMVRFQFDMNDRGVPQVTRIVKLE